MQRKKRSGEEWRDLVAQWQQSGLSKSEFAAKIGVGKSSLSSWAVRVRESAKASATTASRVAVPFVEVLQRREPSNKRTAGQPFELWLRTGDRLVVPAQFDGAALRALLSTLEQR